VERVTGTIRRECLDHTIVLNEASPRRTLSSYFSYYHRSRTRRWPAKDAPESRPAQPPEFGNVAATPSMCSSRRPASLSRAGTNDFRALVVTSIDGQPPARSRKMLLAAGARVANTGMKWDRKRTSLLDWSGPPTLIEPAAGTITLRNLAGAAQVEAAPLSSAGNPMGAPIRAKKTAAGWEFAAGAPAATWYPITRR
jgi:hypothetical protein